MPAAWESAFTPATRDGSGNYVAGDISIRDVVMDRVKDILKADAKVTEIFGDKVKVIEGPFGGHLGTPPVIYIWAANTTEEQEPTNIVRNQVRVFVAVLWWGHEIRVKEFGEPSVASVIDHLKSVLRAEGNRQLVEKVDDEEKPLANKSQLGTVDFTEFIPEQGVALMQFDWVYEVKVDLPSGLIHNLVAS